MTTTLKNTFGQGFLGHFLFAFVIACASFTSLDSAKAEEGHKIVVISEAAFFAASDAAKKLNEDYVELQKKIAEELSKEANAIKKEEGELKSASESGLYAPEVFEERAKKFNQRVAQYQVLQQQKQQELDASLNRGRSLIANALKPIINDMIKKHQPTIMLDASQLMFASPDVNITPEVMKRLNDSTPSVEFVHVTREMLIEAQKKAVEAAQAKSE